MWQQIDLIILHFNHKLFIFHKHFRPEPPEMQLLGIQNLLKNGVIMNRHLFVSLFIAWLVLPHLVLGQGEMVTWEPNVTSFSAPVLADPIVLDSFSDATAHPEYGILPFDAPCTNCVEILEMRSNDYRYYVDADTTSKFYSQKFAGYSSYPDISGFLLSYDPRLVPLEDGIYRVNRQDVPAQIDIAQKSTSFLIGSETFTFNRNLRMWHANAGGAITVIGLANWSEYTVGENGIRVFNIWPGVDMLVSFQRDIVKTDFIIMEDLGFSEGFLIIEDRVLLPEGYALNYDATMGTMTPEGWRGRLFVQGTEPEDPFFEIDQISVYDQSGIKENATSGLYNIDAAGNLEMRISSNWLADPARVYPVVIDPLVTSSATYTAGSMEFRYNGEWCGGANNCIYNLTVPKPANCTLTSASFNAEYRSVVGAGGCGACWMSEAAFYLTGPCGRSPASPFFWSCLVASAGTCTGTGLDMTDAIDCLAPECSGDVTFSIYNSYCYCSSSGTDCTGTLPCQRMNNSTWSITLVGHNMETLGDVVDGSGALTVGPDCCITTVLDPDAEYGVPPYTYLWSPSGSTAPDTTVFSCGDGTWTYTCEVTDACNVTRTATFNLVVDDCGVLPIQLLEFSGIQTGDAVQLTWSTANEVNNDQFIIERSSGPDGFVPIGKVDGAGISTEEHDYNFLDEAPLFGMNYYRLNMVNGEGTVVPAEITQVLFHSPRSIVLYPNPADKLLTIETTGWEGALFLINNTVGKEMYRFYGTGESAKLDIADWPSGVYMIMVQSNGQQQMMNFVVN